MAAELIYVKIVSNKALVYSNQKIFDLLKMDEKERPITQPIFGNNVSSFEKMLKL